MRTSKTAISLLALLGMGFLTSALAAQNAPRSTADSVRGHFHSINSRVLEMAKDFPEDKYDFKLKPEMRSFGEVLVHVASGNVYAAKAAHGEKVNWDELDAKDYKGKAAIVDMLQKAITDSENAMKSLPDDAFSKRVEPWLSVAEHSAEHYGLLVAYYRANGLVPPASRPSK